MGRTFSFHVTGPNGYGFPTPVGAHCVRAYPRVFIAYFPRPRVCPDVRNSSKICYCVFSLSTGARPLEKLFYKRQRWASLARGAHLNSRAARCWWRNASLTSGRAFAREQWKHSRKRFPHARARARQVRSALRPPAFSPEMPRIRREKICTSRAAAEQRASARRARQRPRGHYGRRVCVLLPAEGTPILHCL